MVAVQTVLGPVALEDLGETMMHEHIFFWNSGQENKRVRLIVHAREELLKLAAKGGKTILDVGPLPARNMDWYKELALQVPLNIVMSTGFYLLGWATPVEEFGDWTESQMVARFTGELYNGIGDSGIRAGLIKVAANKAQLIPWEERVMRSAGRIQKETGVPICTHACEGARSQFDLLVQSGADPERIYMSHVEAEFGWEGRNLREEAKYLEAICKEGGSLFFNNYLFEFDTPHEDMMFLMHYLLDKGYLRRILFGMDVNFNLEDDGKFWSEAEKEHPVTRNRTWEAIYTGWIPLMRSWGFTDEHFHTILVENPRRMFSTTRI